MTASGIVALIIFALIGIVIVSFRNASIDNRQSPSGTKFDYQQGAIDARKYGKNYYNQKKMNGGYDVPINKDKNGTKDNKSTINSNSKK